MRERPPGWYPDDAQPGRQRWWDGGTWSHVTRPVPGSEPPPPAEPPSIPDGPGQRYQDPRQPGYPQAGYPPPGQQPYQGPPQGPGQPPGQGYPPNPYPPNPYQAYPGQAVRPVPRTPDGMPLAGPLRRLVARVIDAVLIQMIALAVGFPYTRRLLEVLSDYLDEAGRSAEAGTRWNPFAIYGDSRYLAAAGGIAMVQLVVGAVYQIPQIALVGATLGKRAVGLRVRAWERAGRPGWRAGVLRWCSRELIGAIPLVNWVYNLMDSLWLLWDERRQCLHDKVAGTVVVDARSVR